MLHAAQCAAPPAPHQREHPVAEEVALDQGLVEARAFLPTPPLLVDCLVHRGCSGPIAAVAAFFGRGAARLALTRHARRHRSGFLVCSVSCRSVADREAALLLTTLADGHERRTFATKAAQHPHRTLLATTEGQRAVSIKRIVIRAFQVLLATPSLIAGGVALGAGGKAAGSAWSQHLLEALLIIAVLEWVLRHDWSQPSVRGLTEQDWIRHWDEEECRDASERARVLFDD